MGHDEAAFAPAGEAFRRFFNELRDAFLEREALFTQLELGLLCREHVLVLGPPGTAKSAIAQAVLGRIVDEATGKPSLFSKQLTESSVQTDLVGAVDFKTLTETGRTEYLTDEGMLGASHALLDEIFDGRDMLLRSILNVLHERELKHGRQVTAGRCDCAVMTSNRYLSEVLARSPETLQAFADRLSFIGFCPKTFARRFSRGQMLHRAERGQRPSLQRRFTQQQLEVLRAAVDRVEVPGVVLEGLEALADGLERELLAQVTRLPDYVPTKYFSQRTLVKALWALKAAVVRSKIHAEPGRPLVATTHDLAALRSFFLLGGPPPDELETVMKAAVDPRERAQLEIIRVEHRVFDEVLRTVLPGLEGSVQREWVDLGAKEDVGSAEAVSRTFNAPIVIAVARSLRRKLVPGPRHHENRAPMVGAARHLVTGLRLRSEQGLAGQGEGRGGVALLDAFTEVYELCRAVPELQAQLPEVGRAVARFCQQATELVALTAESTEFDERLELDGVAPLASALALELARLSELVRVVGDGAPAFEPVLSGARSRVAEALERRAERLFMLGKSRRTDPREALAEDGRRLVVLETALAAIAPRAVGVRQRLLTPSAVAIARGTLERTRFEHFSELSRVVAELVEALRREKLEPGPVLTQVAPQLEALVLAHLGQLERAPALELPQPAQARSGDAYQSYRQRLSGGAPEGELAGFTVLEEQLRGAGAAAVLSADVRPRVVQAELGVLSARVKYLRGWLSQLLSGLPTPEEIDGRAEAERAFDGLVKSRFPMLATREGELVRLQAALARLAEGGGPTAEASRKVDQTLRGVAEDFAGFSRRLLEKLKPTPRPG